MIACSSKAIANKSGSMLNHRAAILSQTRYRQHQSIRANFEMIVEPLRDILGRNSPRLMIERRILV
jgi:hypothetical protein